MMSKSRESLFISGIFGSIIGGLFMCFGGMGNFLCEMLFWLFVLYAVMIYFEIIPNEIKVVMKKCSCLVQYIISLAWVPLAVGGAVVIFLGSLLFVDYSITELEKVLIYSKLGLSVMMVLSLFTVYAKKFAFFRFKFGF